MSNEENQFNVQGYNIVTILKRLEAATLRLEDITIFQEEANRANIDEAGDKNDSGDLNKQLQGSEGVKDVTTKDVTTKDVTTKDVTTKDVTTKSITEFKEFISSNIEPFVEISKNIDPIVGSLAELFLKAFKFQSNFLLLASITKKPNLDSQFLLKILNPINSTINQIGLIKDENRKSPFFNHLNTISEGSPVLGWILTDTPISFIPDFKDSAKFWSNRVLKEFKLIDNSHTIWVNQFLKIFDDLIDLVKKFYSTGPWNPNGKSIEVSLKEKEENDHNSSAASNPSFGSAAASASDAASATSNPSASDSASGSASNPPSGSAAPPPPPPPPASFFTENEANSSTGNSSTNTKSTGTKSTGTSGTGTSASSTATGISAVFADLNQGEAITSGLRKVELSEMTHKNPNLRVKKPNLPKKPINLSNKNNLNQTKKPKKELIDGVKWIIENYTKSEPIIIKAEMGQSIFIGNCEDITIQILGKGNAISVSDCKNIGIVIDSLVSGIDIIRSYKFGIQVIEKVPMINIDKSDEGNIYISQLSIDEEIQIFSSSSTALNINVPENDDFKELSVPEQFIHKVVKGKLISQVVDHCG